MFFSELAAILITAFLTVGVWKLFHPDATLHSFVSSGKLTTTTMKPSPIEENEVSKYMDTNTKPCEDFYKFACGNYNEIIPESKTQIDNIQLIEEKIKKEMLSFLNEESLATDAKHVKLVKSFFRSCNVKERSESLTSALGLLMNIGKWPLETSSFTNDSFSLEELIFKVREKTGLSVGFFSVKLMPYLDNSKKVYLIEPQSPPTECSTNYDNYMKEITGLFTNNIEKVSNELKQICKLIGELYNITLSKEDVKNKIPVRMEFENFKTKYSNIVWDKYFQEYLSTEVKSDDIVIIRDVEFFKEFNTKFPTILKIDQANYIMWTLVDRMSDYLNDEAETTKKKFEDFYYKISGDRLNKCYKLLGDLLKEAVSAIYVQNFFDKDSKMTAEEIVKYVQQQFETNIKNTKSLEEMTRTLALEKINHIYIPVGHTDLLNKIDEFYEQLEINEGNLFESFISISKFKNLVPTYFPDSNDKKNWINRMSSTENNFFYEPLLNLIDIPGGILQGVFFNKQRPMYMNYGALGFKVGREINHGFDDVGRNYDKEGNYHEQQAEDISKFEANSKCFEKQYEGYTDANGKKLDGKRTLRENIADTEGLKTAYLAYKNWAKEHDSESSLPDLNYTPSQLFWISFAQSQCMKQTQDKLATDIQTKLYSPAEFRVKGSLANQPDFANDFKCTADDKMNPRDKCSIWGN